MKRHHDGRIITQVYNLMNVQRERPRIDENDPYITKDSCLKYSSLFSKQRNKIPEYMVENNDLLEELTTFSSEFWKDLNKLQMEREEKRNAAEKEKERLAEIERNQESQIGEVLNKQVDSILRKRYFVYKQDCPARFPRKSYIDRRDHEAYLRAFIKFQIRPPRTKAERAELEYFQGLQSHVFDEQHELMEFAEKVFRMQLPEINTVPQVIDCYIKNYIDFHLPTAQKYPSKYMMEMKIPIKSPIEGHQIELQHTGHLLSMGVVPWLFVPIPDRIDLPKTESVGKKELDDKESLKSSRVFQQPVSEDSHASYLAKQWAAHVVMSASAFKTLANNHDSFVKEWDIPVTIRLETVKDSDGEEKTQKVIYMDKKLVKRIWLPLQKKKLFYKKAAHESFFVKKKGNGYKFNPEYKKRSEKSKRAEEDPFMIPEESEFPFGSPYCPPIAEPKAASRHPRSWPKRKGPYNRQDLDNPDPNEVNFVNMQQRPAPPESTQTEGPRGYLDELLQDQSTLLTSRPLSPTREHMITSNIKSYMAHQSTDRLTPWSNTLETDWNDFEGPEIPSVSGFNYHYQLYKLDNKKDSEESISMLIRHKIHGLSKIRKPKNRKFEKDFRSYVVNAKVENQAYFGCEVNRYADIVDQWATLAVRPNTSLLHLRACAATGTVMVSEHRTIEDVLREGKQIHIQFDPQIIINSLYTTFNMLARMPPGQYVLHHNQNSGSFYELLKYDPSDSAIRLYYDLHNAYTQDNCISRVYADAPFLPIDTHVLTPFHLVYKKIPATFPMHFDNKNPKEQKKIKEYYKNKQKKKLPE